MTREELIKNITDGVVYTVTQNAELMTKRLGVPRPEGVEIITEALAQALTTLDVMIADDEFIERVLKRVEAIYASLSDPANDEYSVIDQLNKPEGQPH